WRPSYRPQFNSPAPAVAGAGVEKFVAGDCCIALSGPEDLLSPRRHTMTAKAALDIPVIPPLDPARFVEVDLYSQEIKADPSPWFLQWADKPPFYVMV